MDDDFGETLFLFDAESFKHVSDSYDVVPAPDSSQETLEGKEGREPAELIAL